MKKKRKKKIDPSSTLWSDVVIEMALLGFSRGMALGALYGILISYIKLQSPNQPIPFLALIPGICFGLPFGAGLGTLFGTVLGLLNGIVVRASTQLLFFPVHDWGFYRFGIGTLCIVSTFDIGLLLFGGMSSWLNMPAFEYVFVPSLIAATVSGYASQRAAKWYLAAVSASPAADTSI